MLFTLSVRKFLTLDDVGTKMPDRRAASRANGPTSKCNSKQDAFLTRVGYARSMSLSKAQDYLDEARERLLPEYIFDKLLDAVDELNRTVKQITRDVRRVRREIKQLDQQ